MPYTIHEFSTGLTIEKTTDGGWISKGDTGTWMNSTVEISQIPESITDAIRDSKFDARSISASKPAIIGRVIKGNDDKYWSVVAVIIPGKDESRLLEAYRYFWCEGKDNLCLILGWLYEQLQMPTFNPFVKSYPVTIDETTDGKYKEQAKQKTNNINNDIGLIEWLKTQFPLPIICSSSFLNSETMPLLTMDRIATAIAGGKYLVSWAYNVAALEKQEQFLLIVSSNEIAYNTFSASKPVKTYSLVAAEIASESDLNSAIQNLISLTNVQQNLIIINKIIEKLKDQDIPQVEKYFTKVFDKLGAADALKHNVKDVGMLELLTLRAILLPNTLPEYLLYAGFEEKAPINLLQKILNKFFQKNNSNQIKQQSLAFQSTLYHQIQLLSNELPNIKAKLKDGLITIIEEFYKKQISRSILFWLVTEEQSLWSLCHQELANSVADDLENIFNNLNNIIILYRQNKLQNKLQELNLNIWKKLITDYCILQNPIIYDTLRAYQFLGDLFFQLDYHVLVFYFYTVSGVKVNQEILTAVREYQTEHKIDNVFGLKIPQKNSTVSGVLTLTG